MTLDRLAQQLTLGDVLATVTQTLGAFTLRHHWTQGEFHHDLVLTLDEPTDHLPGSVLVIATNCNGGVKELIAFDELPAADALWRWRCPDNPEFAGELPAIRGIVRTVHWFNPCDLLSETARSELRPEHRRRQRGGGWIASDDDSE